MALKLTDPVQFLQNLVIKKGNSDVEGVYLTSVTVSASAQEEYEYEYDPTHVERASNSLWEKPEWHTLMYNIKSKNWITHNITFSYGVDKVTAVFFDIGGDLSMHVFIPELDAADFVYEVTLFTSILQKMASLTGKTCSTVKFTIGYCLLYWDAMVQRGEAKEMDVAF